MTTDLLPDLTRPGDPGWDAARSGWNTAIDQHPAAVLRASSVAGVQAAVAHARAAGLRIAPQATGHGSEALSLEALRGALLLRTSGLDAISVDPAARPPTSGRASPPARSPTPRAPTAARRSWASRRASASRA